MKLLKNIKKLSKNVGLVVNNADNLRKYKFKGVNVFVHIVDNYIIRTLITKMVINIKNQD